MRNFKTEKINLAEVARRVGVSEEDVLSHCRRQELVDARSMIVALLQTKGHLLQTQIAPIMDISQAAVSHLITRHRNLLETDKTYANRWTIIAKQLTPCDASSENH